MKLLDFLRFKPGTNGKQLTEMRHPSSTSSRFPLHNLLPNTEFNYAGEVGDGRRSSVLAAPFNWIARNFPQAPAIVQEQTDGQWVEDPDHAMTKLLRNPNPFYSGRTLAMALVLDLVWGNAYMLKIRNAHGEVIQLWWAPRWTITPRWPRSSTDVFISHYEYRLGGGAGTEEIDPEDIIHIRFGLDPLLPRLGYSQLAAVMRDVFTDDEAANFSAAVLKNMGIIGVVISPKEGGTANKDDIKQVKDYIKNQFTGDKRGEALAVGSPTDVKVMQYQMQGFDVSPIRDISEERVCAALGIPAAVIGFGTGLQQTKVGATMREMRRMAWTDGLIPLQEIVADELERSLLPEFNGANTRVRFDLSSVPALWEEANEKHDRVRKDTLAGIIMVSKAQELLNYPVDDDRNVYLQPTNLIQLPDGQLIGGNNE